VFCYATDGSKTEKEKRVFAPRKNWEELVLCETSNVFGGKFHYTGRGTKIVISTPKIMWNMRAVVVHW
jgi:hypothetical protein